MGKISKKEKRIQGEILSLVGSNDSRSKEVGRGMAKSYMKRHPHDKSFIRRYIGILHNFDFKRLEKILDEFIADMKAKNVIKKKQNGNNKK